MMTHTVTQENELTREIKNTPSYMSHLVISKSRLQGKTDEEIDQTFAAIPPTANALSLRLTFAEESTKLISLLTKIPSSVTKLLLFPSDLNSKTATDLAQIFAAIPPTVTELHFIKNDGTDLLLGRTHQERDLILNALNRFNPISASNSLQRKLKLPYGSESSFARALLPMLSLVKQTNIPREIAFRIFSFLLLPPPYLSLPPWLWSTTTKINAKNFNDVSFNAWIEQKLERSLSVNILKKRYRAEGGSQIRSLFIFNTPHPADALEKLRERAKENPEGASAKTLAHFVLRK